MATATAAPPKVHKFRVISGTHNLVAIKRAKVRVVTKDKEGKDVESFYDSIKDPRTGKMVVGEAIESENDVRTFRPGDVIETTDDLSKLFDKPGSPPKFERITPGGEFSAMTGPGWNERRQDETMEIFRARMADIQAKAQQAATMGGDEEQALNAMTYDELCKMCAEEEIDRTRVKPNDKQALVKTIMAATKAMVQKR